MFCSEDGGRARGGCPWPPRIKAAADRRRKKKFHLRPIHIHTIHALRLCPVSLDGGCLITCMFADDWPLSSEKCLPTDCLSRPNQARKRKEKSTPSRRPACQDSN